MAHYNRWQNDEIFAAASRLSEEERRKHRGAFFGSIHGTLSHLYWADRIWLSRFDLIEAPAVPNAESPQYVTDFDDLVSKRHELDEILIAFCDTYEVGPVEGSLTWFSGAIGKETKAPLTVIFTHFFNHQTHHRGQVHAMLTSADEKTADTDLFLMPPEYWPAP